MQIMKSSQSLFKWISVSLLTFGASLFLGLLSFSGMYVLWPMTGLAILSFVLSVLYEGEIYKKNLNKALDKLFNKDLVLEKIGEEIAKDLNKGLQGNLEFLTDYRASKDHTMRLQKMHIWLAKLLIEKEYEWKLRPLQHATLEAIKKLPNYRIWSERTHAISQSNRLAIIFSSISVVAMSLGTAYLIVDALEVLPFISIGPATLPFILIPLSIISGIAYGLLTYNSLSDFFLNSNISDWWEDFKATFLGKKPLNSKNIAYGIFSALIIALNLALTICTAGTWWTVINQSRNLGTWLQNGVIKLFEKIIPLVIGISTLGFNLKNTIDTIKHFKPNEKENNNECNHHHEPKKQETTWQRFNIFRLILKLTYMPVRILLFLGHLFSIGVTGDRMPGVSPIASAILGMVSEGFEDTDYFFDLSSLSSDHHHDEHTEDDHVHSDLPNLVLQICFMPIFLLAALWHKIDSDRSFKDCLMLMLGRNHEHHDGAQKTKPTPIPISTAWIIEESCAKVEDEIERLSNVSYEKVIAGEKIEILQKINNKFSDIACNTFKNQKTKTEITSTLNSIDITFNEYLFWQNKSPTTTAQSMLEVLPDRKNQEVLREKINSNFSDIAKNTADTQTSKTEITTLISSDILNKHRFWQNESPTTTAQSMLEVLPYLQQI